MKDKVGLINQLTLEPSIITGGEDLDVLDASKMYMGINYIRIEGMEFTNESRYRLVS